MPQKVAFPDPGTIYLTIPTPAGGRLSLHLSWLSLVAHISDPLEGLSLTLLIHIAARHFFKPFKWKLIVLFFFTGSESYQSSRGGRLHLQCFIAQDKLQGCPGQKSGTLMFFFKQIDYMFSFCSH